MSHSASPVRARVGVSIMFFTNGVLVCALLPRYPEIKQIYDLSDAAFGLLVIAMPIGSILAAAFAGRLIRRIGILTVTVLGSLALGVSLAVAPLSPVVAGFAVAIALAGAADAFVDSAQNVQAVLVEQWRGRSVINSLHALWSVGATVGGAIGTAAAVAGIPIGLQMAVNGALWVLAAAVGARLARIPPAVLTRLREPAAEPTADTSSLTGPTRPWLLLLPLVLLAISGTLVEDVSNNWVVLYLGRETGASIAFAGAGLTVALAAQFVGRILGDPMTDRWGRELVGACGGVLAAIGAAAAMLATSPLPAMIGFALAGFGTATLVPAAFAAAGRVPGLPEGTGIAMVSWLMRIGFLVASPIVGVVAQLTDLRWGMAVPLVAGLAAALLSLAAYRRRPVRG